ncbi:uncharacterized protein Tco025E_09621, partial [Trypanosoma conorhini]
MNCYFVAAPIRTERGTTVPVLALPLLDSRDKRLGYLFSAVAATLDLFDSMTPECQVQHLQLAVAVSAAAVTASGGRLDERCRPGRVISRLKELFSRAGLLTTHPTGMMRRFSSLGDEGVGCGALWLYMVVLATG